MRTLNKNTSKQRNYCIYEGITIGLIKYLKTVKTIQAAIDLYSMPYVPVYVDKRNPPSLVAFAISRKKMLPLTQPHETLFLSRI